MSKKQGRYTGLPEAGTTHKPEGLNSAVASFWVVRMTCVNKEGPQRPKLTADSRAAIQPEGSLEGRAGLSVKSSPGASILFRSTRVHGTSLSSYQLEAAMLSTGSHSHSQKQRPEFHFYF